MSKNRFMYEDQDDMAGITLGSQMKLEKSNRIWMKSNPSYTEKWLQDQIANDPSILNLGEIYVKDIERRQPSGGRLDMLFEDLEGNTRFEVELQLGSTDETHIIRTIEYWDIERKRYPNYEHVAVIVAEDITTRFFNVISLFNGQIPIIAIQVSLLEVAGNLTLNSATVLDLMPASYEDEVEIETVGRDYWEKRSGSSMTVVDELVEIAQSIDPNIELTFRRGYCGLSRNGNPDNYLIFKPKKNYCQFEIKIPLTDQTTEFIEKTGLTLLPFNTKWKRYFIQIKPGEVSSNKDFFLKLIQMAKDNSSKSD